MEHASDIDAIQDAVLSAASKAQGLDDLGKAADALKAIADARQTDNSEAQSRRTFALNRMQSLAALLVPIVSILALVVTVVFQSKQITASANATTQQIEDTEWRDLLSSLKGGPDVVYTDVTIAPRLESFATSKTYGSEARTIAIRLMGHLANPDGFSDLFSFVFPTVSNSNVGDVIEVSRKLVGSQLNLENQCPATYDCDTGLSVEPTNRQRGPEAQKVQLLYDSLGNVYSEQIEISRELTEFMRGHQPVALDVSSASIGLQDLSNIKFINANISGTIFDKDQFDGAYLIAPKFDHVQFRGTNWWDAAEISPMLLRYAIMGWNPHFHANNTLQHPITRDQYLTKIKALCDKAGMNCPNPPYGPVPLTP